MSAASADLAAIRRPKILIRAARAGVTDYHRDRDLKRLLRLNKAARAGIGLDTLLAEENRMESKRQSGEATYSIQRHVAILTALLAEARQLAPALPAPISPVRPAPVH